MAQYQITISDEVLHQLFTRDHALAGLVEQVLNQIIQAQVAEHLQAERCQRTDTRHGYRTGFRPRTLKTRVGELNLEVPKVRAGHFSTRLFARYQRSEQALLIALMEMVINGVSTRKVLRITQELCGTGFSKSTVSDLCKKLDPVVTAWNERDLSGKAYPFVIVAAVYSKVRKDHRVISQSALVAVGINADRYREILGIRLGDSKSEDSWSEFFAWLESRGLSGVDLVVSDDHKGLVKAIRRHFQGCSWQRCQTHLKRNVLDACPKRLQPEIAAQLRLLFDAPDEKTARELLEGILDRYSESAP